MKTVAVDSISRSHEKGEKASKIHRMREIKYPGEQLPTKMAKKIDRSLPIKLIRHGSKVRNRQVSASNEAFARHSFDMSLVLETLKN